MSEIQTNKTQPSDFIRALNSTMDNLENVVETLLAMLEKTKRLEEPSRGDTASNEKVPNTKEMKQLPNDATTLVEIPNQEPSEAHDETEMTTNEGINLQQSTNEKRSAPATVTESVVSKRSVFTGTFCKIIKKVSSKSDYYILAVALAILGMIIVRLFFLLFP